MKRQKFVKMMGAALVAVVLICACKKENIYPTIELEAPEDGTEFFAGYDVHFVAELADSLGLKSYTITITAKAGETNLGAGAVPYGYEKSWDLYELKEVMLHHHEIIIPANAATGNYVFTIACTNMANKQSKVSRGIQIIALPNFE